MGAPFKVLVVVGLDGVNIRGAKKGEVPAGIDERVCSCQLVDHVLSLDWPGLWQCVCAWKSGGAGRSCQEREEWVGEVHCEVCKLTV